MFDDDPWRDAGIEAEDDRLELKPRHPWYEYAGLAPFTVPETDSAVPKGSAVC